MNDYYGKGSYPPWSRIQGLDEMCAEAGVDFDQFIDDLKVGMSPEEMAHKHEVSPPTMRLLQEHFMKYGINSVMGGD